MFDQDYSAEPLATVSKTKGSTVEQARNVQDLVTSNFHESNFRGDAFRKIKQDVAEYGVACSVAQFVNEQDHTVMRTVMTPFGPSREEVSKPGSQYVENLKVDPRNYFQDPDFGEPKESPYRGQYR